MLIIKKSLVLQELKEKMESDLYNFEFHKNLAPQDRMEWVLYLRDILFTITEANNNLAQICEDYYSEGYKDGYNVLERLMEGN